MSSPVDNLFAGLFPVSHGSAAVLDGEVITRGSVVGLIGVAADDITIGGSNTGNGVASAFALSGGGAVVGDYVVTCYEAVTDSGNFNIVDPNGALVGQLLGVGTFTGAGITFDIAVGATDFAVGDTFTMAVDAGSGVAKLLDKDAVDGTQNPHGVALNAASPSGSNGAVSVALSGEFINTGLNFAAGTAAADMEEAMRAKSMFIKTVTEGIQGEN